MKRILPFFLFMGFTVFTVFSQTNKEFTGMFGIEFGTARDAVIRRMLDAGWQIAEQTDDDVSFNKPPYDFFNSKINIVTFCFKDNMFWLGGVNLSVQHADAFTKELNLFVKSYSLTKVDEKSSLFYQLFEAQNKNIFFVSYEGGKKSINIFVQHGVYYEKDF